VGQYAVGPKGVGVEVMGGGPFVVAAEVLAEVGVAGSAVVADVVPDGVAVGYHRSWQPKLD
jgi:hypothetical protein